MKFIIALLLCFPVIATAAECTAYEKTHPAYILNGAHLSTGKCTTCGTCHINGIFTGTPKQCINCHNGDPARTTVGRSAKHIPTALNACDLCHGTTTFVPNTRMNHTVVSAQRCDSCHNATYASQGADKKPNDHPRTTQDCRSCHSTSNWDA
jgi:hypothetical protein